MTVKERHDNYHKNNPWAQKLFSARSRCIYNNPSYNCYKKNIKCYLTMEEVKNLWFKYKAYDMTRPSLDRKESDRDYTYDNCRFIEYRENALEGSRMVAISLSKQVDKYSLNKKFIESFKSIGDAAKSTGDYEHKYTIASCCRKAIYNNKRKLTAYGFIWRFKGESPEW